MIDEEKKTAKITIEYNRITKIKANPEFNVGYEYVTRDYSEKLTIDRESETLEYFRKNCNGICSDFDKEQEKICDKCRYNS